MLLRTGKDASGSSVDNSVPDRNVEPEAKDPEHPKRYGYSWAELPDRTEPWQNEV